MISLFVPPGWTLHAGGPHIALDLLKGYLEAHGVEAETCDLNTGSAVYHKTRITEAEVVASCRRSSADDMNATYFGAEDRLGTIAARYDGTWFAHEGFQRRGCDLGNPEHVREYSREASPFTAYFLENVIPDIIQRDPKIVGLSIYVPSQLLPTFEFVRLLRQFGYRGFIVLGGNHITRIATDMRLPWVFDLVDGIVAYQGERTLKDLYLCLRESGRLETVANLTWRDSDGVIRTNQTSHRGNRRTRTHLALGAPLSRDRRRVFGPEDVNALAESLSDIVWAERPEWSHPIYRMFSPSRSLDAARGISPDSAATSDACRPSQTAS